MMQEMFDRIVSLRVGDVMARDPICVEASASMEEVAEIFSQRGLHFAPVIESSGRCIGIISASDFVKRTRIFARTEGQPHELVQSNEGIDVEPRSYDCVIDCMTEGIQTVETATSLIAAARIMSEAHLHVLPVVENHMPVGIISNLDVVAALVNAFDEAKQSL